MTDHVLTNVEELWRTHVGDGGRCLAWSPGGRLLVVGADGRALVGSPAQVTTPLAPDPVDAAWRGDQQVVVIDAVLGAVFAGSGVVDNHAVPGARCVDDVDGLTVVAGADVLAVFGRQHEPAPPDLVRTDIGSSHALAYAGGGRWAIGGTTGVALVDTILGRVETRLELDAVRAVGSAPQTERFAVADLGGSLRVIDGGNAETSVMLHSFAEPVRHVAMSADGKLLVASTGERFTWWWIDESNGAADEPILSGEHDAAVTALAMGRDQLVASGDASGAVRLWSPWITDRPIALFELDSEIVEAHWAPSGRQLAVAAMSGEVVVVEVSPGLLA